MPTITLYQHTPLIHFQADQPGATLRATEVKPRLDRWLILKCGQLAMAEANERQLENEGEGSVETNWSERKRYDRGWEWLLANHPGWAAKSDKREERQRSLNYQLTIAADAPHELNGTPAEYANFFADMGDDPLSPPNRSVTFHHTIRLTVHSASESLIDVLWESEPTANTAYENGVEPESDEKPPKLRNELTRFFYATNFGMRSSKGFGSFSPARPVPKGWAFKFKVDNYRRKDENGDIIVPDNAYAEDQENLFRHLEFFHKSLRGGLNNFMDPELNSQNKTLYMKPLLFQYAMKKKLQWEKKVYKMESKGGRPPNYGNTRTYQNRIREKHPNTGFQDALVEAEVKWPEWYAGQNLKGEEEYTQATVRDVLGLSTDQSWYQWGMGGVTKKSSKGEESDRRITRAPSPLTFVPVQMKDGFAVYVYARQPDQAYLKHLFKVEPKREVWSVELPVFPGFDMETFLSDYLKADVVTKSIISNAKNDEQREDDEVLTAKLRKMYHQAELTFQPQNILQA